MIAGMLEPDSGSITGKYGLSIGYLHQDLGWMRNERFWMRRCRRPVN
jgi:ATPase subunit of ABC transporter with duplicated ATPase domains